MFANEALIKKNGMFCMLRVIIHFSFSLARTGNIAAAAAAVTYIAPVNGAVSNSTQ
jgi:hypothetical protein